MKRDVKPKAEAMTTKTEFERLARWWYSHVPPGEPESEQDIQRLLVDAVIGYVVQLEEQNEMLRKAEASSGAKDAPEAT